MQNCQMARKKLTMPNRLSRPARNYLSWVFLVLALALGLHLFQQYLRLSTDRVIARTEVSVLEDLLTHGEFAVVCTDAVGAVTVWNPAATRLFGWTAEEMMGQSFMRILPPELAEEHMQLFQKLQHAKSAHYCVRSIKCRAYSKTGKELELFLTIRKIPDAATYKILVSIDSPQLHADPAVRAGVEAGNVLHDYSSRIKKR